MPKSLTRPIVIVDTALATYRRWPLAMQKQSLQHTHDIHLPLCATNSENQNDQASSLVPRKPLLRSFQRWLRLI